MSRVVLDSSAMLALLYQEPGGERVAGHLATAVLSAVNLSEVVTRSVDRGMSIEDASRMMAEFSCEIMHYDAELAYLAASLRPATRLFGLSFGDRACLALGLRMSCPVVTADKSWSSCDVGVKIIQIR